MPLCDDDNDDDDAGATVVAVRPRKSVMDVTIMAKVMALLLLL